MNWSFRVCIRFIKGAIIDFVIVQGPESFIRMLMSPDFQINTILVEKIFQSKPTMKQRTKLMHLIKIMYSHIENFNIQTKWSESIAQSIFHQGAVIIIFVTAIHGSVTQRYNPWTYRSVYRVIGFLKFLQYMSQLLIRVIDFNWIGLY